jgi:esterase/lipase
LIHGLSGSPFSLYNLGKYFLSHDFLVRSILLPGHGTVPGDLLEVKYQEWLKATQYGTQSLTESVKDIFLVGHSLGGTLAIHQALQTQPKLKALILFAPALESRSKWAFATNWHKTISWAYPKAKWIHNQPLLSYAKYSSMPFNALHQSRLLMKKVQSALKKNPIKIPMFIVISDDDETICPEKTLKFFSQHENPHSRLLIYSTKPLKFTDSRISVINSVFPDKKILNFSHPCLPVAPNHPHFGEQGDFVDFGHYENPPTCDPNDIYSGAITSDNLKQHTIKRLTYNPDFNNMMKHLNDFLKEIE